MHKKNDVYFNKNFTEKFSNEFPFEIKDGIITKNKSLIVSPDKINVEILDKTAIRIVAINDEQIIFSPK